MRTNVMDTAMATGVREWLLRSRVQLDEGPEAGAVAGWLDARGRPSFAYGEITGYYLTWAAFVAREQGASDELVARGERALGWLERRWRNGVPPTRCLLVPDARDWRNAAVFTFDLAMVLRGLSAAADLLPAARCRTAAAPVLAELTQMIDHDGCLKSHRLRPDAKGSDLPETWSTRPGPHLVKAAAAILRAGNLAVPGVLREAARRTAARWSKASCADVEPHPSCYFFEGLLLLDGGLDESALAHLQALLARVLAGEPGAQRGDVLAQALRLARVVEDGVRRREAGSRGVPAALSDALARHCDDMGAVCFQPADAPRRHRNAWASMFADQALSFRESGSPLAPELLDLLV